MSNVNEKDFVFLPETLFSSSQSIVTIDLGSILRNWNDLRQRCGSAECGAVVKADAYGLGDTKITPLLAACGCCWFFVAQLEEAVRVKQLVPGGHTICLGRIGREEEQIFETYRIIPTLNHLEEVNRWRQLAHLREKSLPAFIHLDSGMNRLGLDAGEVEYLGQNPEYLEGIEVWFWMSHFACADEVDVQMTHDQYERFQRLCDTLPRARKSLCNSSGIFRNPVYHFDLVRPGSALYGINPTPETDNPMYPVVSLMAPILQIRTPEVPSTVGYGGVHKVTRGCRIATVGIGYADGYLRSLGEKGKVFIADYEAPVIGRISMDLITIDVSHIPESLLELSTYVEIIGPHHPLDAMAQEAGTIAYEILTSLGLRYHRHYIIPQQENSWYY